MQAMENSSEEREWENELVTLIREACETPVVPPRLRKRLEVWVELVWQQKPNPQDN